MRAGEDTIYALSSGQGRAAIALVRLSGSASAEVARGLCGDLPRPRRAVLRALNDPDGGGVIDRAMVIWLPGPHTFSGEDMLELHVHGGPAVVAALFRALRHFPGLRPAERGEFTRRAVENGRMGLVDAEGLADLIAADTEAQRKQALRQASGGLDEIYEGWRNQLLALLAHLEAHIDFVDEEGVPLEVAADVRARSSALAREISSFLTDNRVGERLREGLTVVIAGPPNAGKSSLLNRLARREVAIVSDRPGTTRDLIEVHLDLGGYPVVLVDTAGLREAAADEIEDEGMRRARKRAGEAALVIWVTSPDADGRPEAPFDSALLRVVNKSDLIPGENVLDAISISAKTGSGLDALVEALTARVQALFAETQERPLLTRERHRVALSKCCDHLLAAAATPADELVAEDLRRAAWYLGKLVGRIDIEDILGQIFSEFCIGK